MSNLHTHRRATLTVTSGAQFETRSFDWKLSWTDTLPGDEKVPSVLCMCMMACTPDNRLHVNVYLTMSKKSGDNA